MNTPSNLLYTKSHEWVQFLGEGRSEAMVGLTDFAQESLGSIVFVSLPAQGDTVVAGESLGEVESVKAVSDIISPVGGKVEEVNEELLSAPEKINEDSYGAWLVKVVEISENEDFLSAGEYEAFCREEQ